MTRLAPALLLALAALALPGTAGASEPTPACDVVAALEGSDANAGAADSPVRSVRRAVELLEPGQAACLTAGETFHELVNFNPSGTAAAPLTLRSTDGGRAAFTGQIRVNGSHVRISGIDFRGLGAVASFAPKTYHLGVDGDDVVLSDLEITSPKGICVDVGQIDVYGGTPGPRADGFVLEHSRVHGCGLENELTGADSGVHGIYLKHTSGARLADLFVHDNINRGIQLWPAASGTLIERVTLDGNGSNLNLGSYAPNGYYSTDTVVRRNVIASSRLRSCSGCDVPPGDTANVVGNFPAGGADHGNRIEDDCVFQSDPTPQLPGLRLHPVGEPLRAAGLRRPGGRRPAPGRGIGVRGLRRDRRHPGAERARRRTSPGATPPAAPPGAARSGRHRAPPPPLRAPRRRPPGRAPHPPPPPARAPAACSSSPSERAAACGRASSRPGRAGCGCASAPPAAAGRWPPAPSRVRRRSTTAVLRVRSSRRRLRLTVTFRDRHGATASARVAVG